MSDKRESGTQGHSVVGNVGEDWMQIWFQTIQEYLEKF